MKRQGRRDLGIFSVVAGVVVALVLAAATSGHSAKKEEIPFKFVQLFIEFNSSAPGGGDAGIQVFLDADAWRRVKIEGPDGRVILDITAKRNLKELGITELRFESEEPSLADLLALFPEGEYEFEGTTVDGQELDGVATLSHAIPAAAVLGPVDPTDPVINWTWAQAGGPPLASFQVIVEIVENDVTLRSMTVDLPPSATSLAIPPEFLQLLPPGAVVKFEVLAVAENLNRTITEGEFEL